MGGKGGQEEYEMLERRYDASMETPNSLGCLEREKGIERGEDGGMDGWIDEWIMSDIT